MPARANACVLSARALWVLVTVMLLVTPAMSHAGKLAPLQRYRAVITEATATAPVHIGDVCDVYVETPHHAQRLCRSTVDCGGTFLFGHLRRNGFFPCQWQDQPTRWVAGGENNTTGDDAGTSGRGDGAYWVDTRLGAFAAWDDDDGHLGAFRVAGRFLE